MREKRNACGICLLSRRVLLVCHSSMFCLCRWSATRPCSLCRWFCHSSLASMSYLFLFGVLPSSTLCMWYLASDYMHSCLSSLCLSFVSCVLFLVTCRSCLPCCCVSSLVSNILSLVSFLSYRCVFSVVSDLPCPFSCRLSLVSLFSDLLSLGFLLTSFLSLQSVLSLDCVYLVCPCYRPKLKSDSFSFFRLLVLVVPQQEQHGAVDNASAVFHS